MKATTIFFLILAATTLQAATTGEDKNCGPPNYCARTDQRIQPYPARPPALGRAGTVVTDPSFGARILRVTDGASDPVVGGRSMMTPSSSEQNAWNSDGTKFYILTPGGQFVLYSFDPRSLKIHQDGALPMPWSGEPEFSYTQPSIIYGVRGNNPAFQQYDTSSAKGARVHLISECVRMKDSEFGHGVFVSADDGRLGTILGPRQDLNFMVYVYDRKLGCRWYNTQTGEIGGQWGPKGTVSIPDRYGVHNSRISKSGEFVEITRGASSVGKAVNLIWEVATMRVVPCLFQCLGHHAMGYSHVVNPSQQRHPLDLLVRPLNDLESTAKLVSELQATPSDRYWLDLHLSWNHIDQEDKTPVCLSTYSGANSGVPGAPLDTIAPWENEILCAETDGKSSKVWRFAHTYSTAKNGFWSTPRGNISRDGRFFMFTSDWENQLGQEPRGDHHRTDVFIVELR